MRIIESETDIITQTENAQNQRKEGLEYAAAKVISSRELKSEA
jgi:hypothetical protein